MTILEAREILELSEDEYSDSQIEEIIDETFRLAKFFLDRFMKGDITPDEAIKEFEKTEKSKLPLKLFTKISYNSDEDKSKLTQVENSDS